jgi:hypothetical protein
MRRQVEVLRMWGVSGKNVTLGKSSCGRELKSNGDLSERIVDGECLQICLRNSSNQSSEGFDDSNASFVFFRLFNSHDFPLKLHQKSTKPSFTLITQPQTPFPLPHSSQSPSICHSISFTSRPVQR